jgi:molecular chaperone DnaJ
VALGFDPYAVLDLSRDATVAQIAQARRRLSRQYHPDVNSAPDAAARFDEVQRAFSLLSDPAARAEYDRASGHPGAAHEPGTATWPAHGIAVQPASVDFGRLGAGRPAADATVTVSWTGARPSRITGDQGTEWWTTVGSAMSASSSVVLFHLRARAPAGIPDGRRHGQFTVTLDGTQVTVPLTAEFSGVVPPTVPDAVRYVRHTPWVDWLIVAAFVVIVIVTLVIH